MFKLITRSRGYVVKNLKSHMVKRQIKNYSSATSVSIFTRRNIDKIIENNIKKFETKFRYIYDDVGNKKYSNLAVSVKDSKVFKPSIKFENSFAYSVLQNTEVYAKNIANLMPLEETELKLTEEEVNYLLTRNWKGFSLTDIVEAFINISKYAVKNNECITDEKYDRFINYLIANCNQLTDDEICEILKGLIIWPRPYGREVNNFLPLYRALDKECTKRYMHWSIDKILLHCDHWYKLDLLKRSEFCSKTILKLATKSRKMTPANLVQYMFYVNCIRKRAKEMYDLEYRLESCVDELSINELAIIAMGFFKTETPIRNHKLLFRIIHRVIDVMDIINEISLTAFMKIARYSFQISDDSAILWQFLVSTVPQVSRLSLTACVHIIMTSVKLGMYHPELLNSISKRCIEGLKDSRAKDLERLLLGLSYFNFTPDIQPNIFETIAQELSNPDKIVRMELYTRSLAYSLEYLSVMNVYPKNLLAFLFDPENIKQVYGSNPYKLNYSLLVTDLSIDIEVPDYQGPRLSSDQRVIIAKENVNRIPKREDKHLSKRHKFLFEVQDVCKKIFNTNDVPYTDWILPQFKEADIIICLDKNNSPISVEPILSKIPFGSVKRPQFNDEECRWLALVIGAPNCYIRYTNLLLGKDETKLRQLRKIGYEPIMVYYKEWYGHNNDELQYLKSLIFKE